MAIVLTTVGLFSQLRDPVALAAATDFGGGRNETVIWVAFGLVGGMFAVLGALVAVRRPDHPVGWLVLVLGAIASLDVAALGYAVHGLFAAPGSLPGAIYGAWFDQWYGSVILAGTVVLLLLFPTGRLPSPRWRLVAWVCALSAVAAVLSAALMPGGLSWMQGAPNPVGLPSGWDRTLAVVEPVSFGVLSSTAVAAMVSVFVRLRRARGIERQQLKWFTSATALLGVTIAAAAAFKAVGVSVEDNPTANTLLTISMLLAFIALLVSITVAVLRFRLYDIDRIVSRTVSYAIVTVILAAIYVAGVVGLGAVLRAMTGWAGGDLLVAASTLAVAAAFRPAQTRVQRIVDRRFNRRRADAQRTLEGFAQRLRDEVNVDSLRVDLLATAIATVSPAQVDLWLSSNDPGR